MEESSSLPRYCYCCMEVDGVTGCLCRNGWIDGRKNVGASVLHQIRPLGGHRSLDQ